MALGIVAASALAARAQPAAPLGPSANRPCVVATDAAYGRSPNKAIQVGGGPMYGSARQRRLLDLLRGPQGQAVTYDRSTGTMSADDGTLVDSYSVKYDGLDAPISIVLDWYHYSPLMVPKGFTCGAPLELGTPPPDPFTVKDQVTSLARATTATAQGPIAPIPLGATPADGFILDRFRLEARKPPVPGAYVPEMHRMVVVVLAKSCDGRRVTPTAISLAGQRGQTASPIETFTQASRFSALDSGVTVPDGSMGAVFQVDGVVDGIEVRATFSDRGCTGEPADRTWRLRVTPAELADAPMPQRPKDDTSSAAWVALQTVIDLNGAFREVLSLGGPDVLVKAATTAIKSWRVTPAKANGAPIATPVVVMVSFVDPPK